MGLWVLVMFACSTRTKEMGIRKVLGASRWNLLLSVRERFLPTDFDSGRRCATHSVVQYAKLA